MHGHDAGRKAAFLDALSYSLQNKRVRDNSHAEWTLDDLVRVLDKVKPNHGGGALDKYMSQYIHNI